MGVATARVAIRMVYLLLPGPHAACAGSRSESSPTRLVYVMPFAMSQSTRVPVSARGFVTRRIQKVIYARYRSRLRSAAGVVFRSHFINAGVLESAYARRYSSLVLKGAPVPE